MIKGATNGNGTNSNDSDPGIDANDPAAGIATSGSAGRGDEGGMGNGEPDDPNSVDENLGADSSSGVETSDSSDGGTDSGLGAGSGRAGDSGLDSTGDPGGSGDGDSGIDSGSGRNERGQFVTGSNGRRGRGRPRTRNPQAETTHGQASEASVTGETGKPETPDRVRSASGGTRTKRKPASGERRRASGGGSKVGAKDVKRGVHLLFGLAAIVKQAPHWQATDEEIEPWAADAAELLSKIPAPVVQGALNLSSGVAVAMGLGMMVQRRVAVDIAIAAQRDPARSSKQPPNERNEGNPSQPTTNGHASELVGMYDDQWGV